MVVSDALPGMTAMDPIVLRPPRNRSYLIEESLTHLHRSPTLLPVIYFQSDPAILDGKLIPVIRHLSSFLRLVLSE